jgi:hypothetical protein
MGLIMVAIWVALGLLLGVADPDADGTRNLLFATWVLSVVVGAWNSVAAAVTYHDLRVVKEGAGAEDLARVFD